MACLLRSKSLAHTGQPRGGLGYVCFQQDASREGRGGQGCSGASGRKEETWKAFLNTFMLCSTQPCRVKLWMGRHIRLQTSLHVPTAGESSHKSHNSPRSSDCPCLVHLIGTLHHKGREVLDINPAVGAVLARSITAREASLWLCQQCNPRNFQQQALSLATNMV